MKDGVKVLNWSSWRGLNRSVSFGVKFTPAEMKAITADAYQMMVRPSDIIRGALIYAGVIEEPISKKPPICITDGTGAPCVPGYAEYLSEQMRNYSEKHSEVQS